MNTQSTEAYSPQGRELREHGTAEFPAACYETSQWISPVPLHWHEELEAGFITGGEILLLVGREPVCLSAGDGFFVNSGIPHGFLPAPGAEIARMRSVVFDPALVGGRFDSVFWRRYAQPVTACAGLPWLHLRRSEPWQAEALEELGLAWDSCRGDGTDRELEVRYRLSRLLAGLSRHLPPEPAAGARRIQRDNERIRIMLRFIQSRYAEELTVEKIAASALVSTSEALRCFHNTIGMTPVQYLKHYRVQQAAEALRTTDRKVARIGEECGFREMSYFARTFREIMGTAPAEYRKQSSRESGQDKR